MVYNAIGLMSGSSLDGLDIVYAEFTEQSGKWSFAIKAAECSTYPEDLEQKLRNAAGLSARDYLLLHAEYGHYLGKETKRFIDANGLEYRVALIGSHGHTVFHLPKMRMTSQLGDGAAIASETGLPVVSELRAMDVALGGQGAPIVPIGEKYLLAGRKYYLNIGGIANLSFHSDPYIAFDVCPANRVLNMLAQEAGNEYDEDGRIAASGNVNDQILDELNKQAYYEQQFPKSLANDFGTDIIYPIVKKAATVADAMRTMAEHISMQLKKAVEMLPVADRNGIMLITGGGALNSFLVSRIKAQLTTLDIQIEVPSNELINYKEALIMAFIAILRWRQESNVLSSVTGAARDSIGGALWQG